MDLQLSKEQLEYLQIICKLQQKIKCSFKEWFEFIFPIIEGKKLIHQEATDKLLQCWQDIYDGKYHDISKYIDENTGEEKETKMTIININICPRVGKTMSAVYFIAYAVAREPKSNFIYCSYSWDLLKKQSEYLTKIIKSNFYQDAYYKARIDKECFTKDVEDEGINYQKFLQVKNKDVFSSRRIHLTSGAEILFSTSGGTITGFGAGVKGIKDHFAGCVIMDDINKIEDDYSMVLTNKKKIFFDNTLYSRQNEPDNKFYVNVQQRISQRDMSQHLIEHWKSKTFKIPIVDKEGKNLCPASWSNLDIERLKENKFTYHSQYLQEPLQEDERIFDEDCLQYYNCEIYQIQGLDRAFFTCDISYTDSKTSNYMCICQWGVVYATNELGLPEKRLYLLDYIYDKFDKHIERFDIIMDFIQLHHQVVSSDNFCICDILYIEHNNNGELVPRLENSGLLNINPKININGTWFDAINRSANKKQRAENVCGFVNNKKVFIPNNMSNNKSVLDKMITEFYNFPKAIGDGSHFDFVDCVVDAVSVILKQNY